VYAIAMNGLYWNATARTFSADPTRYPSWDEAVEAAQEDAALPPDAPWSVVPV
jgi:hypothetical protein